MQITAKVYITFKKELFCLSKSGVIFRPFKGLPHNNIIAFCSYLSAACTSSVSTTENRDFLQEYDLPKFMYSLL